MTGRDSGGKFKCSSCRKCFDKEMELAIHRYYFHKEVPYVCWKVTCGSSFWSSWHLRLHATSAHVPRKYVCEWCLEIFNNVRMKKQHILQCRLQYNNTENSSMDIGNCNEELSLETSLPNSYAVYHSDGPKYICQHCKEVYKSKESLTRHIQIHIPELEQIRWTRNIRLDQTANGIVDNVIAEEVLVENEIQEHELICVGDNDMEYCCIGYKCPECSLLLAKIDDLKSHVFQMHSNELTD